MRPEHLWPSFETPRKGAALRMTMKFVEAAKVPPFTLR
jgi:hypothetical protein